MYWWQSDKQIQEEINCTITAIKKASKEAGKSVESAKKFLLDAGIISEDIIVIINPS